MSEPQVTMSRCEFCGENVEAARHTVESCRDALVIRLRHEAADFEQVIFIREQERDEALSERDRLAVENAELVRQRDEALEMAHFRLQQVAEARASEESIAQERDMWQSACQEARMERDDREAERDRLAVRVQELEAGRARLEDICSGCETCGPLMNSEA